MPRCSLWDTSLRCAGTGGDGDNADTNGDNNGDNTGDDGDSGVFMSDEFDRFGYLGTADPDVSAATSSPNQLANAAVRHQSDTQPEIEVIYGMTYVPILKRFVPTSRIWLAMSLLVLNICDVLTTRLVLTSGGVEVNPIMVGLMQGTAAPLMLKTVVSLIAGALLLAVPRASRRSEVAVACVVGLYLAIVLWNLMVFMRL